MLLGAWFLGPLADRIGRKNIYLCSSLLLVVSSLISAIMEIIGPDYRAITGVILVGLFSASVTLLPLLAYLVPNWRITLGILVVLEILHLMLARK